MNFASCFVDFGASNAKALVGPAKMDSISTSVCSESFSSGEDLACSLDFNPETVVRSMFDSEPIVSSRTNCSAGGRGVHDCSCEWLPIGLTFRSFDDRYLLRRLSFHLCTIDGCCCHYRRYSIVGIQCCTGLFRVYIDEQQFDGVEDDAIEVRYTLTGRKKAQRFGARCVGVQFDSTLVGTFSHLECIQGKKMRKQKAIRKLITKKDRRVDNEYEVNYAFEDVCVGTSSCLTSRSSMCQTDSREYEWFRMTEISPILTKTECDLFDEESVLHFARPSMCDIGTNCLSKFIPFRGRECNRICLSAYFPQVVNEYGEFRMCEEIIHLPLFVGTHLAEGLNCDYEFTNDVSDKIVPVFDYNRTFPFMGMIGSPCVYSSCRNMPEYSGLPLLNAQGVFSNIKDFFLPPPSSCDKVFDNCVDSVLNSFVNLLPESFKNNLICGATRGKIGDHMRELVADLFCAISPVSVHVHEVVPALHLILSSLSLKYTSLRSISLIGTIVSAIHQLHAQSPNILILILQSFNTVISSFRNLDLIVRKFLHFISPKLLNLYVEMFDRQNYKKWLIDVDDVYRNIKAIHVQPRITNLAKKVVCDAEMFVGEVVNGVNLSPQLLTGVLLKINEINVRLRAVPVSRKEPFCIWFFGKPGTRKSTNAVPVASALIAKLDKRQIDDIRVYNRCDTAHWDNYSNQDIVMIDDAFCSTDDERLVNFLQMISPNDLIVPMASIGDKGLSFDSRVVVCTANTSHPAPVTYSTAEAIWRRRHALIEVVDVEGVFKYRFCDPVNARDSGRGNSRLLSETDMFHNLYRLFEKHEAVELRRVATQKQLIERFMDLKIADMDRVQEGAMPVLNLHAQMLDDDEYCSASEEEPLAFPCTRIDPTSHELRLTDEEPTTSPKKGLPIGEPQVFPDRKWTDEELTENYPGLPPRITALTKKRREVIFNILCEFNNDVIVTANVEYMISHQDFDPMAFADTPVSTYHCFSYPKRIGDKLKCMCPRVLEGLKPMCMDDCVNSPLHVAKEPVIYSDDSEFSEDDGLFEEDQVGLFDAASALFELMCPGTVKWFRTMLARLKKLTDFAKEHWKALLGGMSFILTCIGGYFLARKFYKVETPKKTEESPNRSKLVVIEQPSMWNEEGGGMGSGAPKARIRKNVKLGAESGEYSDDKVYSPPLEGVLVSKAKSLQRNLMSFIVRYETKDHIKTSYGTAINVRGKVVMIPYHYVATIPEDVECMITLFSDTTVYTQLISKDTVIRVPKKDLCFLIVHNLQGRNIIESFMTAKHLHDIIKFRTTGDYLLTTKSHMHEKELHKADLFIEGIDFVENRVYSAKQTTFSNPLSVEYTAETKDGWCGSPLIRYDVNGTYIMGIHVAGGSGRGNSMTITKEELQIYLEAFGTFSNTSLSNGLKVQCGSDRLQLDVGNIVCVDEVKDLTQAAYQPTKTNIVPSMLAGIFEIKQGPTVLHVNDERYKPSDWDGISPKEKPITKAVKKYAGLSLPIKQKYLDNATDYMVNKLCTVNYQEYSNQQPMTCFEVVNGRMQTIGTTLIRKPGYEPIAVGHSAGYPLKSTTNSGSHHLFPKADDDEHGFYAVSSDLLELVEKQKDRVRRGKRLKMFYIAMLKDERRPLAKITEGKSRAFMSSSKLLVYFSRYYLSDFIAWMHVQCGYNFSAIGVNAFGPKWTIMAKRLFAMSSQGFAGDYSNWDGTVPAVLMVECCKVVNRWYNDSQENQKMRKAIFDEMIMTRFVIGKTIYEKSHGMPSGCVGTSEFNSIINQMVFLICWQKLAELNAPSLSPTMFYDRHVVSYFYGDDNIHAVSDVVPWFNAKNCSEVVNTFGFLLTSEIKEDVAEELKPLTELTFLKRKFTIDDTHRFYYCPLIWDTIEDMVMWRTRQIDPKTAVLQVVDCALREAFHHGKVSFEKFHKVVKSALHKKNVELPHYSYNEMHSEWIREQETGDRVVTYSLGAGCNMGQLLRIGDVSKCTYREPIRFKAQMESTTEAKCTLATASCLVDTAAPAVESAFSPISDSERFLITGALTENETMKALETTIEVASFEWLTTATSGTFLGRVSLPGAMMGINPFQSILGAFAGFVCDLDLQIRVNGNAMCCGGVVAYWDVFRSPSAAHGNTLIQVYSRPHVRLSANGTSVQKLNVKYANPNCFLKTNDGAAGNSIMGNLCLIVAAPLQVGTGSTSKLTISVMATMKNVRVTTHTSFHNPSLSAQSGSILDPMINLLPKGLATRMKMIMRVMGAAAPLLSLLDKPNTEVGEMNTTPDLVSGNSALPSYVLSLDRTLASLSSVAPDNPIECMSIKNLLRKWSFLEVDTIGTSDTAQSLIGTYSIMPMPRSRLLPAAVNHLEFFANLFQYWRGSIEMKFVFHTTQFHRCRLMLSLDYLLNASDFNSGLGQPKVIIDISEKSEFDISIPFVNAEPYKYNNTIGEAVVTDGGRSLGNLNIFVVEPLTAGITLPTTIYYEVFIRAGPDFELAVLKNNPRYTFSPITLGPTAVADEIDDDWLAQSGELVENSHGDEPQLISPMTIDGICGHLPIFDDMRPLLKRFFFCAQLSIGPTLIPFKTNGWQFPASPTYESRAIGARRDANNLIRMISSCYTYWSGSLNYCIIPNNTNKAESLSGTVTSSYPTVTACVTTNFDAITLKYPFHNGTIVQNFSHRPCLTFNAPNKSNILLKTIDPFLGRLNARLDAQYWSNSDIFLLAQWYSTTELLGRGIEIMMGGGDDFMLYCFRGAPILSVPTN